MNGAENLVMTGSSNPRTEHLNWISEVAAAVPKGTPNRYNLSQNQNAANHSVSSNPGNVGGNSSSLFRPSPGPVFSPPAVLTRNLDTNSVRMFAPSFQAERTRHMQPVSVPIGGTSATLYYSQAPRSTPYSNFFQATYSSPMTFSATASPAITTTTVGMPEVQRTYLQVDSYPPQLGVQTIGSSHSQIPCSPGYLQQHPTIPSSPTTLGAPASVGHSRLFQQGRSILISRFPEEMVVHSSQERETPTHVRIQLSPVLTQILDDNTQRKSFTSVESVLGSSSCSPVIETTHSSVHDFALLKEPSQQRMSPSHVGYRMPTGKEGSLKHRILRPPSINIVDPPPSVVSDAPLSAPPIRTHREPSPKQARSIPSSGYRSFSSSASSLTETSNRIASSGASPGSVFPNHHSSISSGTPSPAPPASPTAAQLKYPQSFMKGAIIQLANNQLKQVENMTTDDFIECGLLSPTLRIDSSTVTNIEKTPSTGAAKLGFHVGQDNIQITVEAPLEHPFFVYKQGWSSCSPDRSAQRYGLECHKLKVGDTCISLTDKPRTTLNGGQKVTNMCVPITNSSTSERNRSVSSNKTVETDSAREISRTLCLPSSSVCLPEKQSDQSVDKLITAKSEASFLVRKRKRRWSAPDNVPQNEDETSL